MNAHPAHCPTCEAKTHLAAKDRDLAIELAHVCGVAFGILIAGGTPVEEARETTLTNFCEEHAGLIFAASRQIADTLRARLARAAIVGIS